MEECATGDGHFGSPACREKTGGYSAANLNHAILLKSKRGKPAKQSPPVECVVNATGVINIRYMWDHSIPCLQEQLQTLGGGVALLSWILPLHIFHKLVARHEALWYEVCCDSGGFTMFIQ